VSAELPPGWVRLSVGELGEWRGGGTPSKARNEFWTEGSVPWISPKDMKRDFIDDVEDHITEAAIAGSATQLIPAQSVLVVTRSGILRHSLPVAINTRDAAINQDLKALTPVPGIDPRFVAGQFRADAQSILSDCAKTGTTVDSVDFDRLKSRPFRLPPPAEQRRIVEKIEALFARSSRARDELAHIPRLIERYRQAVLEAAFRGDLTAEWRGEASRGNLPGSWRMLNAVDLFDEGPTNGYSPKAAADGRGTTSLKLSATTSGTFTLNEKTIKRLVEDVAPDARCWLRPGDVLVQRANSLEYLGATAIFDGPPAQYVYPDLMMRVRIGSSVTRQFFWRYMNSVAARDWLRNRATGTAGNMPKISGAILRDLPVPLPPEDEQAEIVRRVEERLMAVEAVRGECQRAAALTNRLDKSILDKAFTGELVPQNPADEPAAALLARIKASRMPASPARRGRSRRSTGSTAI
jgi:type I restriction enzyme S subunit